MSQWPSWTNSLACCAYLRDTAREIAFGIPAYVSGWPHDELWDADRVMTEICRRFLHNVEEETRAGHR